MTYLPQIGHTVIIADKANFYNGREAVVTGLSVYGDMTVYTVTVGNVSQALTRAKLREVKYVD